ncbi:M12 family metallo-peptidase [Chryseobacterium suipulveris]|uniref:M12 family metallo-peptidase n=1 Tax=Chryseobacterium suipulveris TaxID=2929800 RepID=A0ABY4BR27_9FLAO|nr:zinc-dependent metalloprotease family protein [Chryseobacterium suipulveris]UOE40652.1 M12 family metallo-peptidase [Chryseobacterium suipulveris]
MKKIFTSLLCGLMSTAAFAQWAPTTMQGERTRPEANVKNYYSLDLNQMRAKLANAQESGKGAVAVEINLPTLDGKTERFAVYSAPVVVKSLADRYQLGSYAGVGIDDPAKYVRFSVSPTDFQSMMFTDGKQEFIEPLNANKSVYGVFPKSKKPDGAYTCHGQELLTKSQIEKLGQTTDFSNQVTNFSKNSDQKFRKYRLALSVTGEYTQLFGGVAGALTQMNATMTRVNGVFEKDFAIRMVLQDFPQIIFTNPNTDPYSPANPGAQGAWTAELKNVLKGTTYGVGDANYDIGHLFGRSGGGGSAGCIGCVCNNTDTYDSGYQWYWHKGQGYTSPGSGDPVGDNFDIDYVAHEMGHQFGAWHTFAHGIHSGSIAHMEPGSGSTIMGYAGITSADVQPHSDPYFHAVSIFQVQNYVQTQNCDVNTPITNQPPVITPMPDVTIPKGTAFALTATATDPENDPITYTWEQYDGATAAVTDVTANNTQGPKFRSIMGTTSPTRYFPKTSMVMNGILGLKAEWESVSNVARVMNFRVTVRDNNSNVEAQQTQVAGQKVTIHANGPFKITSTKVYNNAPGPFTWDVVGTDAAPFYVANVKIEYTQDNGVTWNVIAASTPNDGTEELSFASFPTNTQLKMRVSAIGNVFYAVAPVIVSAIVPCDGTAPAGLTVSNITTAAATVSWDPIASATYILRWKKASDTTWNEVPVSTNTYTITGLEEAVAYEVQVASVCTGTTGTYTPVTNFSTLVLTYCTLTSTNSNDEYISNVTITAEGATGVNSSSGASNYTDYTTDNTRTVHLAKGTSNNVLSVSKAWTGTKYSEAVTAWIDFNRNGTFEPSELVMQTPGNQTTPVTQTFSVPADAYSGDKPVRMRVALKFNTAQTNPCGSYTYGEVEDYAVIISPTLGVNDNVRANAVQVYPNPAVDVLNVSKVSNNATYSIYNAAGQLVAKGNVADNKVSVSKLQSGVYFISVDDKGTVEKVKFIKK